MKKGRVLFIVHDLYQDDLEFPIGIGYLASALMSFGAEVVICNQNIYHYSNEELVEKFLKDEDYDLIGIGFLAARFRETVLGLCKVVNTHKKKAKLILGGHGPSPIPTYILKTTNADLIGIGECEEIIIEVLDAILQNKSFEGILGIAYRDGSNFYINQRRPINTKIDTISSPAYDLFPVNYYTNKMIGTGQDINCKAIQIISSRGCTNRCTFCYRLERGIRFRDMWKVIQEMRYLYDKYEVSYFHFLDELFAVSYERLNVFVDELRKEGLLGKIQYNISGIRANDMTDRMAKLFQESGCVYINIGFESMSQQCLNELKKNVTVEENIRCVKILREYDIYIGLNFIWGSPSDNEDTLNQAVDFLMKYNTYGELRTIRPITPYPGSEMYEQAITKGLLTGPEDFFNRFKNSDLLAVNFTKIPTEKVYDLLFEANKNLILDHYKNTTNDVGEAYLIINNFHDLYFKGFVKFRGARKYGRIENV